MQLYFWNIRNSRPAVDVLARFAAGAEDVLFSIAEFWNVSDYIAASVPAWQFLFNDADKRTGLLCPRSTNVELERGFRYYTRYAFNYRGRRTVLYVVHLKSMTFSERDSARFNLNVSHDIAQEIADSDFNDVIVIGDFNLPHFHDLFIDFYHLNATDYWSARETTFKTYEGARRMKFYNPIVSFSGDMSAGPPGTYYYSNASQSQAWHIFDNILVAYPLAQHLDRGSCGIVTQLDGTRLLSANGRPDELYSDHLPVMISLS